MESIISYIVIIALIIVSIYVYNIRKKQSRVFVLSNQDFPDLSLSVNVQKNAVTAESLIVVISTKNNIRINDIKTELITSKREFNYYNLDSLCTEKYIFPVEVISESDITFTIPFDDFKSLLADGEHPFRTFRFVIYSETSKPFKSHELGFNKKWVIYRPDSGNYN